MQGSQESPEERAANLFADALSDEKVAQPDVDALCAEHPDLAPHLRSLASLAGALNEAAQAPPQTHDEVQAADEPFTLPDLEPASTSAERLARLRRDGTHPGSKRYRVDREVARGGMGAILRVWDGDLRRFLAMKVARDSEVESSGRGPSRGLVRFLDEAQITGQLDHPGIVPVHELGLDEDGRLFFTMRLVRGVDFSEVIRRVHHASSDNGENGAGDGEWTLVRALGVLLKACEAVAFAHSKGVVHRDLKPGNLMVGRFGEVYVMDWGLARVLDDDRERDRTEPTLEDHPRSVVATDRKELRDSDTESPLLTKDGDIVGTPAYMPPEQASGQLDEVGPAVDVYALGAVLYHLLTGLRPYAADGNPVSAYAVVRWVLDGAPKRVSELAEDVPPELEAICEKAMARDPRERYADVGLLAEDLRAYLEGRVVRAHKVGAIPELTKWVKRNRPLAVSILAGVVLLAVGLGTALILKSQSDENARVAESRRDEVLRLSALQKLEDLEREADELWPVDPDDAEKYTDWIHRAEELVEGLHPHPSANDVGHLARLAALRERSLPPTAADRESDRRSHPRRQELEVVDNRITAVRQARDFSSGERKPPNFTLGPEQRLDERFLNEIAWPLVDPARSVFGQETRGLALARLAHERASSPEGKAVTGDTLAWALFANGRFDEAVTLFGEVLEIVPDGMRDAYVGYAERLRDSVRSAESDDALAALEAERDALDAIVSVRRTWRFADDDDSWWHSQLQKLVSKIGAFADPERGLIDGLSSAHGLGVRRRLRLAEEMKRGHSDELPSWENAVESIRGYPVYGGLGLTPQLGLVPLGPDPESELWEFAHLASGEVPKRDGTGKLSITKESSIVLVLIPAGTYTMGAQKEDPNGPNFDLFSDWSEAPTHEVSLSAFFLSKYELTQGQWLRFVGANPSFFGPDYPDGTSDLLHPVEMISWFDASETLRRLGMMLPTEAQWEYAARAGTGTPWWTGKEAKRLADAGNIAERSHMISRGLQRSGPKWDAAWDDGHGAHARVGSFRANAFGLCDVVGNVEEWCQDAYDWTFYMWGESENPLCERSSIPLYRVFRGGSFDRAPNLSRSASRGHVAPEFVDPGLGVRPARAIAKSKS